MNKSSLNAGRAYSRLGLVFRTLLLPTQLLFQETEDREHEYDIAIYTYIFNIK